MQFVISVKKLNIFKQIRHQGHIWQVVSGISRVELWLVVVWPLCCTKDLKEHSLEPNKFPLWPLKIANLGSEAFENFNPSTWRLTTPAKDWKCWPTAPAISNQSLPLLVYLTLLLNPPLPLPTSSLLPCPLSQPSQPNQPCSSCHFSLMNPQCPLPLEGTKANGCNSEKVM